MQTNVISSPILLVDDEPEVLMLTRMTLESEGINNVLTLEDSRKLMPLLAREKVSLIVLDLMMPHHSGIDLLQELVVEYPDLPIIVMTALDEVGTAVECLKSGAFDYLLKPVEPNSLISTVGKALRINSLQNEISSLKSCLLEDHLANAETFKDIISSGKKMRAIFQYAEVIAQSRQPTLLTGETGTGKEMMATAIHKLSGVDGGFIPLNVAGLDDAIFSDTLFGHTRGAFTGADRPRDGLIAKAANGTLFLDEIGDLSQLSQIKLLRLLQENEYYQLGSDMVRTSNARIIMATNHNLEKLISEGRFRKDLYYRLCAYQIHLPPLRERLEDIPLLLHHFNREAAKSFRKPRPVPSQELIEILTSLHYPGNVREFKSMVYDAVARHQGGILSHKHFRTVLGATSSRIVIRKEIADKESDPLSIIFGKFPTLEETENYMIDRALKLTQGRAGAAAALLGISRQCLYKKTKPAKLSIHE